MAKKKPSLPWLPPVWFHLVAVPERPHRSASGHDVRELQMTAEEYGQACAEGFAAHCLRLDLDDALEVAAEFQISTP